MNKNALKSHIGVIMAVGPILFYANTNIPLVIVSASSAP